MHAMPRPWIASVLLLAACGGPAVAPDASPVEPAPDAAADQVPPTGRAALEAWLETGAYLSWHCEAAPHPARPPGAHGENRICSNDAIAAAPDGELPVGAASVKELYDGDARIGFAVAIKRQADSAGGDGWYWFENFGGTIYADGDGVALCTGCHEDADDYVFTRVP
jgi:hypothetical protein